MKIKKTSFKLKKGDLIAILAALSLAIVPSLFLFPENSAKLVAVYVDGAELYRAPLFLDAEIQAGDHNLVLVSGGVVTMKYSDCPDGICLSMRAKSAGESVVCLPNRVSAQIIAENGALDAIAY